MTYVSDHILVNPSIISGLIFRKVNMANYPLAVSVVIDIVRVRHGTGGKEGGRTNALRCTFIDERSMIL